MTLTDLARHALMVQDASNLSGVVQAWADDIGLLRELLPDADTQKLNRHSVNRLYAEKVLQLAGGGIGNYDTYSTAYDECQQLAKERDKA